MLCTCYYFVYYSPLYYLFLFSRVHLLLSSPALPLPSTPFRTSIKLRILPYVPDFYSYHCRSVLVPKRRKEKKKPPRIEERGQCRTTTYCISRILPGHPCRNWPEKEGHTALWRPKTGCMYLQRGAALGATTIHT